MNAGARKKKQGHSNEQKCPFYFGFWSDPTSGPRGRLRLLGGRAGVGSFARRRARRVDGGYFLPMEGSAIEEI